MSRYTLLFLLALPFIIATFVSELTQYKLGKTPKNRFLWQILFLIIITAGLVFMEPIYTWLFNNHLTQTESLSLFDVVQIIAIIALGYVLNRARLKLEVLERRIVDLHQELSIKLSDKS